MRFSDRKLTLLLLAVAAAFCVVTCDDRSTRCKLGRRNTIMAPANLTCSKPTYCCYTGDRMPQLFCCDNCRLSLDPDDCDYISYWKYVGYAIGGLGLLLLLAGLIFGLVKLVKSLCCKHRSSVASSAGVADYPRNVESVPEWQQPPKKPPEYYDIFTVSPPPAYKERPEST